jgi:hypothetical protein
MSERTVNASSAGREAPYISLTGTRAVRPPMRRGSSADTLSAMLGTRAREPPDGVALVLDERRLTSAELFVERLSPVERGLGLTAQLVGLVRYAALRITGFQTLYVNQGATFGSNGIFDYVALILWGIGADVASRGVGNAVGGPATPATA